LVPVVPPLLATAMPGSDNRTRAGIPCGRADYSTCGSTLSPIGRTLVFLLLIRAFLLSLGLLLWLGRWRWRSRICWWRLR